MYIIGLVVTAQCVLIAAVILLLRRADKNLQAVTARNEELLEFSDRYLHLYRSSPIPYIHLNRQGVITMSNVAARRLFGIKETNLTGVSFTDRIDTTESTTHSIISNKIASGHSFSDLEIQIQDGAGRWIWVSVSGYVFSQRNDMFVTLIDITQKKKVEQAKSEFVSMAAHQLRSPLSATNMALSMLTETLPDPSPDQHKYLGVMHDRLNSLAILVDDFLSVSKLEAGNFATTVSSVAIHEEIPRIINNHDERIRGKRIAVRFSCEPETIYLNLDEQLFRMVIGNLISNAAKYNREAGELEIKCVVVDDMINITVADSGMGIPLKDQPKLFEKFHRAHNVREANIAGNGLGLYIVKQALVLMSGNISFESEEGRGTTFTITLPAR